MNEALGHILTHTLFNPHLIFNDDDAARGVLNSKRED